MSNEASPNEVIAEISRWYIQGQEEVNIYSESNWYMLYSSYSLSMEVMLVIMIELIEGGTT